MPVLYKFENIKVFVDIFWQRMRPIGTMNDSNSQFIVVMLRRYHKIKRGVAFMHSLVDKSNAKRLQLEVGFDRITHRPKNGEFLKNEVKMQYVFLIIVRNRSITFHMKSKLTYLEANCF